MKHLRFTLFAVFAALLITGCGKSEPKSTQRTLPYSLSSQTIAHLHWLGKKQLAASTNAAGLMRIWNEPESAVLGAQTLDKLSTAPWRLLPHVATTNTAAAPLLRALLDDCVEQESYLEIRATTNQPGEIAFAIHLPADRAALWQTNLATVLESLTGIHPTPVENGWSLQKHELPNLIEFTRIGEWVVIGVGEDKNALFGDFAARVLHNQTPVPFGPSDFWVDAEVDLRRVAEAFKLNWKIPADLAAISLQTTGDGQNVHTRGMLGFSPPFTLKLEPWSLPSHLIRVRLGAFTAMRGIGPWLSSRPFWKNLQIGPAPDQVFAWESRDIPLAVFMAAHSSDASRSVSLISTFLLTNLEPRLVEKQSGHLEMAKEFNGLQWTLIPFATPFLQSTDDFILAGLLPNIGFDAATKLPKAMIEAIDPSNLVYYDWEVTGPRMDLLFQPIQLLRMLSRNKQLPAESPSAAWLMTNAATLGTSVTSGFEAGPGQIAFVRRSTIGFTALELHLLADWLGIA